MRISHHIYHDRASLDYTRILRILLLFVMYLYPCAPPTTINHLSSGYVRICMYTKCEVHLGDVRYYAWHLNVTLLAE
jgi:hypothetical protein